jgi:hypothetical protein
MARRLVLLTVLPLALVLALVVVLIGADDCLPGGGTTSPGTLSPQAEQAIPPDIAAIYVAIAKRWNIDVAFLASIGAQETDHGRHPTTNQVNASGCQGLMQLGVGGACGDYWHKNKCDGNNDGQTRVKDPWDNICAAARGLRRDKGAPPAGGSQAAYHQAACNYYGACADGAANYAAEIIARAKRYGFQNRNATDPAGLPIGHNPTDVGCGEPALAAATGQFIVDPGANRPGVELAPELVAFIRRMADFLPRPPIVTTGTNHSPTTTSGNPSDHWTGHGADFGSARNAFPATGGGYGDTIAQAAFLAAGQPPAAARANARTGGAHTIIHTAMRIQIIWKDNTGGNHYNHIHIGIKPIA